AACVAGVFSLEDGLTLVAARGRLMGALPQEGEMVSLLAAESRVREAIAPYADELSIAAINGPASVVISGSRDAVLAVSELLAAEGVKSQRLTVSHAFHSPLMEPMLEEFRQVAERITYHKPVLRLVSNVTGRLAGDEIATPGYWVRHVREAVRFADGVAALHSQGIQIFLEIGPKPVLLGMAGGDSGQWSVASGQWGTGGSEQRAGSSGQEAERIALLPSLRPGQGEWQQLLSSLGALYVRGAAIDWEGFDRGYARRKVALPTYPFQRQRYWVEPAVLRSAHAAPLAATLQRYGREALMQQLMQRMPLTEAEQETAVKVLAALEKAEQLAAQVEGLFYRVRWETQPVLPASSEQGRWLIVGGATEMGATLAEQLTQRGEQVEALSAAAAFSRLQDDSVRWRGVLYLGGADQPAGAANLLQSQQASLGDLLTLLQVLANRPQKRPRLWVVTQQAQALSASDPVDPAQSTLWGLGRVIALEHSDLWGGLVDLEGSSEAAAQLLAAELLAERAGQESQVAYRRSVRHVARLVRGQPEPARPAAIDPSASYLVTGGLGALGLQVATWLGNQGATRLVLTGRRGVTQAAQRSVLEQLAASGVTVQVAELDVADEASMRRLFAELQTSQAPLRGVFHCAGVLDDGILLNQSWERFEGVLRAKVVGGWLLHELTRELDLMVFFSSAAALLGNSGQGSYAAANAFLDGLACLRRQQGLPGLSIQWGAWAGEGMAARVGSTLPNLLPPLEGELALLALEKALGTSGSLAAMQVEWEALAAARRGSPFLASFGALSAEDPATSSLAQGLAALTPNQRLSRLTGDLQQLVARVLGMAVLPSAETGFTDLGMDSLMALELRRELERALHCALPATLAFEHPTVNSLAAYLLADVLVLSDPNETPASPVRQAGVHLNEPIAVVSLACRFPGAETPEAFWQLLLAGRDQVSEVPADRWQVEEYYDPQRPLPGKMYMRAGSFLDGVDRFDPLFFGISPREAAGMDPQHRLLLETSWEALERAGIAQQQLRESSTGVFVGIGESEYSTLGSVQNLAEMDSHAATGSGHSIAAGRIAYTLGVQGPTLAVDTACSSSLVAIHLACQSLRLGECDLALAGGVSLLLTPTPFVALSQMQALSPDGRCKTFDA
ncbi:MAG: SDR family NAD(P)-dependent oxidoreductase, partial [Chloroflexi bacterium]|nr:SDR family NAD(P)-dependent oxidoreductase [Chloroflexota bacterium]